MSRNSLYSDVFYNYCFLLMNADSDHNRKRVISSTRKQQAPTNGGGDNRFCIPTEVNVNCAYSHMSMCKDAAPAFALAFWTLDSISWLTALPCS